MSDCNVNVGTGAVYHTASDFFLPGAIPFELLRDYDSSRRGGSEFGHRWRQNHSDRLVLEASRAIFVSGEGRSAEVPHPDQAPAREASRIVQTRREGKAVILTNLRGFQLRFEPLQSRHVLTAQIDPSGNALSYTYGSDGVIQTVIDPIGRRIEFSSDGRGHWTRIDLWWPQVDARRRSLAVFEYDSEDDLRFVRDSNGGVTRFRYQRHLLVEHVNPLGGRTHFEYDSEERCCDTYREGKQHRRQFIRDDATGSVEVRDSRGAVWRYRFNSDRKPLEEVDPEGHRKVFHYDEEGNLLFTEGESDVPRVTIFFADKRQLINQEGSITTTTHYDERLRVIEEINAEGSQTTRAYDDRSNVVKLATDGAAWAFEYDEDGWLAAAIDPRGHRFQRTRTSPLDVEHLDPLGRNATLRYNVLGLVEETLDGADHATRIEYAGSNRVASVSYADGSHVELQYDSFGNLVRFQPEAGAPSSFEYDRFGAPVACVNPQGHRGAFTYDSEGNLVQVRNAKGEIAAFEYDLLNHLKRVVSFDERTEVYRRDARGHVVAVEDARGQTLLTLERDPLGRITKKIYPEGWEVSLKWGQHNQLLAIRNPDAEVRFDWTPELRVLAEHVNDFSVFYQYDEVGNRVATRTNRGREILYEWDARNRLTRMLDGGREYRFTYSADNLFREWLGPGVTQKYEFDVRQRMTRRTVTPAGGPSPVLDRRFEYDIRGRLSAMEDQVHGRFSYRYSELGAILEVHGGGQREAYDYDENENCVRTAHGEPIRFARGNRMMQAGPRTFDYDSRGSTVRITGQGEELRFEYNPEGRLRQVSFPDGRHIEYRYDPFGRRLRKTVSGRPDHHFFWDRGVCIEESAHTGKRKEYLFLPDTFLPIALTEDGKSFCYVLDQAGSPTELLDEHGTVQWAGRSFAFGLTLVDDRSSVENHIRFQGHYHDADTGFHYNFCRYYDPLTARYLAQDPAGLDSQANVYRYVLNPFGEVDPYGLATLVNGVLTIVPICGWAAAQEKEAQKKMDAMNNKIGKGIKIPKKPKARCGKSAKEIYEDCQKKVNKKGKPPVLPDLNESTDKCFNEQADHMLEICAGGGEEDCKNLQPLNESVNKSFGSQVGSIVRENPGKLIKKVQLSTTECTDRASVNC